MYNMDLSTIICICYLLSMKSDGNLSIDVFLGDDASAPEMNDTGRLDGPNKLPNESLVTNIAHHFLQKKKLKILKLRS